MIYDIFSYIGMITGYFFAWAFFKVKVYYEDRSSQGRRIRKGALIISNHFNLLDYILNALLFFPRKIFVVVAEIAFTNALFRFGMKFWGGIQANRKTKSAKFIMESATKIKEGKAVLIFPEGHNTDDGTIKRFYPSYIAIALRAKSPIIPVITDGNYGLFKRAHVIIGKKIDLSEYLSSEKYSREDIQRLNEIVFQKVLDLREDLDRRIEEDKEKKGKKK